MKLAMFFLLFILISLSGVSQIYPPSTGGYFRVSELNSINIHTFLRLEDPNRIFPLYLKSDLDLSTYWLKSYSLIHLVNDTLIDAVHGSFLRVKLVEAKDGFLLVDYKLYFLPDGSIQKHWLTTLFLNEYNEVILQKDSISSYRP